MGTVTRTRCSKTQRWRRGCVVDNPTAWSGFVARQRQNVAHGSEHKAPLPHLVGACCNAWWCGRRVEILDLRHKMHASAYMGIEESVMTIPAASSERRQKRKWVQGSRAHTHTHTYIYLIIIVRFIFTMAARQNIFAAADPTPHINAITSAAVGNVQAASITFKGVVDCTQRRGEVCILQERVTHSMALYLQRKSATHMRADTDCPAAIRHATRASFCHRSTHGNGCELVVMSSVE